MSAQCYQYVSVTFFGNTVCATSTIARQSPIRMRIFFLSFFLSYSTRILSFVSLEYFFFFEFYSFDAR